MTPIDPGPLGVIEFHVFGEPVPKEGLAWAAGLFDGEGSWTSGRYVRADGGVSVYPRASMKQAKRPDVLHRLQLATGIGVVEEIFERNRRSRTWLWRAEGLEQVQACVALLWRWLSPPKRDQAAQMLVSVTYPQRDAPRCRRGHEQWYTSPSGKRECIACRRPRQRAWMAARRAGRAP